MVSKVHCNDWFMKLDRATENNRQREKGFRDTLNTGESGSSRP